MNTQTPMPQNFQKQDTHSYKGWLNSDSFLKRAFSIYGYMMVAGLIIAIPFYIIMIIMMMFMFSQFKQISQNIPINTITALQQPVANQPTEKSECEKNGGKFEGCGGIMPSYCCIYYYDDGGKECNDGKECKSGFCAYSGVPSKDNYNDINRNFCTSSSRGALGTCLGRVENGVRMGEYCVD